MPGRRVVVTGMAAVTPFGRDLGGFWDAVCQGRSSISRIERFDTSRFRTRIGGEIRDFDPAPHIDGREQRRYDRFAQFAIVASALAVADSGLHFDQEDPYRGGVVIGSGVGGLDQVEEAREQLHKDPNRLNPLLIPRMIVNSATGHISIRHGLRGPNSAVATACASSSNALGDAFRQIRWDQADIMIAGGAEAAITPLSLGGFCAMRALSQRNDDPAAASRPFSRDRDGFVMSEGAGVVVLEEYGHARRRGARIYAEVLGYGSTCDGLHITAPNPEGASAAEAMRAALRDARIAPSMLDYINAHGTSTPLGDKAETIAIKKVCGSHASSVMISSTKSQLGHALGASGALEMVLTALSLYHGVLPPTINLDEPDPDCDLDFVPHNARQQPIRYAMSNSFGFGGHNACLVLGAFGQDRMRARMAA